MLESRMRRFCSVIRRARPALRLCIRPARLFTHAAARSTLDRAFSSAFPGATASGPSAFAPDPAPAGASFSSASFSRRASPGKRASSSSAPGEHLLRQSAGASALATSFCAFPNAGHTSRMTQLKCLRACFSKNASPSTVVRAYTSARANVPQLDVVLVLDHRVTRASGAPSMRCHAPRAAERAHGRGAARATALSAAKASKETFTMRANIAATFGHVARRNVPHQVVRDGVLLRVPAVRAAEEVRVVREDAHS